MDYSLSKTVIDTSRALVRGEDCYFALHDALVDCGRSDLALRFVTEKAAKSPLSQLCVHWLLGELPWLSAPKRFIMFTNEADIAVLPTLTMFGEPTVLAAVKSILSTRPTEVLAALKELGLCTKPMTEHGTYSYLTATRIKFDMAVVPLPRNTAAADELLSKYAKSMVAAVGKKSAFKITHDARRSLSPSSIQESLFFVVGNKSKCLTSSLSLLLYLEKTHSISDFQVLPMFADMRSMPERPGWYRPPGVWFGTAELEDWVKTHPRKSKQQ